MAAIDIIRDRAGTQPVEIGLILGSGLGHLAHAVKGVAIPYADLPDFPHASVSGHNPNLHLGQLEGLDCWALRLAEAPPGWQAQGLRAAMMSLPAPLLSIAEAIGIMPANRKIVTQSMPA